MYWVARRAEPAHTPAEFHARAQQGGSFVEEDCSLPQELNFGNPVGLWVWSNNDPDTGWQYNKTTQGSTRTARPALPLDCPHWIPIHGDWCTPGLPGGTCLQVPWNRRCGHTCHPLVTQLQPRHDGLGWPTNEEIRASLAGWESATVFRSRALCVERHAESPVWENPALIRSNLR